MDPTDQSVVGIIVGLFAWAALIPPVCMLLIYLPIFVLGMICGITLFCILGISYRILGIVYRIVCRASHESYGGGREQAMGSFRDFAHILFSSDVEVSRDVDNVPNWPNWFTSRNATVSTTVGLCVISSYALVVELGAGKVFFTRVVWLSFSGNLSDIAPHKFLVEYCVGVCASTVTIIASIIFAERLASHVAPCTASMQRVKRLCGPNPCDPRDRFQWLSRTPLRACLAVSFYYGTMVAQFLQFVWYLASVLNHGRLGFLFFIEIYVLSLKLRYQSRIVQAICEDCESLTNMINEITDVTVTREVSDLLARMQTLRNKLASAKQKWQIYTVAITLTELVSVVFFTSAALREWHTSLIELTFHAAFSAVASSLNMCAHLYPIARYNAHVERLQHIESWTGLDEMVRDVALNTRISGTALAQSLAALSTQITAVGAFSLLVARPPFFKVAGFWKLKPIQLFGTVAVQTLILVFHLVWPWLKEHV